MLGQVLAVDVSTGSVPWVVVVLVLAAASAVDIPSFMNRGWNLAPPALLALLTVTQPREWGLLYIALAVVFSHLLASVFFRRGVARRWIVLSTSSCLILLTWWMAASLLGEEWTSAGLGSWAGVGLFGIVSLWVIADGFLRVVASDRFRHRSTATGWLLYELPIGLVASGSAVVCAVLWSRAGIWAAAVTAVPYLVTHRLVSALVASSQIQHLAVRAIGRLPEAAGLVESDHSASVERLASEVGRMSGVRGRALSDLRRAAVLHDVGLVCTSQEPVRRLGYSSGDVARWGAEILGSSPSMSRVARLIAGQADPFRIPGASPDPSLDVRSQIIKVSCEVDRLRSAGMELGELVDALYGESAFRFAPELIRLVIPALERADQSAQIESKSM